MKPVSRYARQRTFVEMLQSRIDGRSAQISYCEGQATQGWKDALKHLRAEQVWDKRLMGYIVELQRELKMLRDIAAQARRVWQD